MNFFVEKFSLFSNYFDCNPQEVSLEQVINLIRSDATLRRHTLSHREFAARMNEHAADAQKHSCPCMAVAVRFKGGKAAAHVAGWTGLTMVDFDHLKPERLAEIRQRICADPHTLVCYTTVSGSGMRVLARYDADPDCPADSMLNVYRAAFRIVNAHYAELTGCETDAKCKNHTRLSGLAADPDVFYRPEAEPFTLTAAQLSARSGRLERIVASIRRELAEQGICYEPGSRNNYLMRMGYLFNEFGIPLDEVLQWAVGRFTDYEGGAAPVFRACYQHTADFGKRTRTAEATGRSRRSRMASPAQIEQALTEIAAFRFNVVTRKTEVDDGNSGSFEELTDRMLNSLWRRLGSIELLTNRNDLRAIIESEFVPRFDPFRAYFDSLPAWDGQTDYIGRLAATVHVRSSQQEFENCFRRWLVGMVASLLIPQVVNHQILVLVGPQGIYKTTWFARLLPPPLQRYFCVRSQRGKLDKDDVLALAEFALICMEELDEMRHEDVSQLKAMVTMPSINERAAYGHYKEARPHLASFCGTSNLTTFLNDPTGSRRWLPFEVESIDDPHTWPTDTDGLYAQALHLLRTGFCYWFLPIEVVKLNARNHDFEVPSIEMDLIQTHFRVPEPGERPLFLTVGQIIIRLNVGLRVPLSPSRVGLALKLLGYERTVRRGCRGYLVLPLSADRIYRNSCEWADDDE